MAKEGKKAVVPKLRFPEFRNVGSWDQRTLNELLRERKQRNRDLKYGPDQVLSVSGDHGCVNQIELLGRSYAGVSVKEYHVVETGDIVYTKSPLKRNPYGIIKENKGKPGIVSTLYAVYHATELGHPAYLDHYFSRDYNLNSYLQPIVKKGAKNDMKVNNAAVLTGEILAPKMAEQRKIAECLSSLAELIAVQVRKIEALKTYKRGLMQQLFPREGETLPRLRFPEFCDAPEWIEETLGKHVDIWSGNSPSTFALSASGKYPYVKVEDLNNCTKYQMTGREFCDDARGVVPKHSVLFPKRGAAIELNKIRITESRIQIDTNLMAITPKKGLTAEFLFYCISNVGLAHIADTSTIPQINNKHIIPFAIRCPSGAEQQQVADALSAIDVLITFEVEKLDSFKTHKKGLIQQLFPSLERV